MMQIWYSTEISLGLGTRLYRQTQHGIDYRRVGREQEVYKWIKMVLICDKNQF